MAAVTRLLCLSLRMQLVALVLLAIAPAVALSAWTGQQQHEEIQKTANDHVLALARVAAVATAAASASGGVGSATLQRIAEQSRLPDGSTLFVFDHTGAVLASAAAPATTAAQPVPEAHVVATVQSQQETTVESNDADGRRRLYGIVAIQSAGGSPTAFLGLGVPTSSLLAGFSQSIEDNQAGLELLAVLALAAAWIAGDWLILRHVRALVGATRRLEAGELSVRTNLRQGPEEFVQLGLAFDSMASTLEQDLSRRQMAERRLGVQYAAARVLAEADDLATAATELLRAIGTGLEWDWAAVWRVDTSGTTLEVVQTWHAPDLAAVAAFEHATRAARLAAGAGLPGRVWASGEPSWIADVTGDANFPRAAAATAAGLHAAFGFPITSAGGPVGVIECASRRVQEPDPELLESLAAIGSQVGQFIERERAEAALRRANEELEERVAERTGELATANARLQQELRERRRAEEELQAAKDAAEAANRAKSTFLANMSHELRTPLNAIIGYSEMLEEDARDAGDRALAADLGKIQGAGRHLLSLINNVLDLSKVEAGKSELYLESVELGPVVSDVVATVRPLVEEHANELDVSLAADLGVVRTDVTKLRQALFNLLSNACKFTEHGRIRLAAAREHRAAGDWVTLAVTDTGVGMSPEQMGRLFQPFVQADASTTRRYGGTGLGLALSRHFCQMLGGDISVESRLGVGSTFRIQVPAISHVAPLEAPEREPLLDGTPSQPDSHGGPNTVLVVDDDAAVRETMRRFLEKEGLRVALAADGEQGLRLARAHHPVAITLDVMMPRMDGWAVLSALKADPELATIPVVIVSILDEQQMGRALGATDYVIKPVDWERLAQALRRIREQPPSLRLLVVEDDEAVRDATRRLLERQGWTVDAAENGRVALSYLQQRQPDLIVLDLLMPEVDGFEFVSTMRAHPAWRTIPIVVVTSKSLNADERRQLAGQVQAVVEKGVTSREGLLAKLRDVVAAGVVRKQAAGA